MSLNTSIHADDWGGVWCSFQSEEKENMKAGKKNEKKNEYEWYCRRLDSLHVLPELIIDECKIARRVSAAAYLINVSGY